MEGVRSLELIRGEIIVEVFREIYGNIFYLRGNVGIYNFLKYFCASHGFIRKFESWKFSMSE